MTSFVDLDPTHPGGLLGLAPGRSGASVRGWLALHSSSFRDGIKLVAIDPSAPFAAALREALPSATLVVDHWHLHRLANLMVTQVRLAPPARDAAGAWPPRPQEQRQLGLPAAAAARRPAHPPPEHPDAWLSLDAPSK